jgi:hypothetical protein
MPVSVLFSPHDRIANRQPDPRIGVRRELRRGRRPGFQRRCWTAIGLFQEQDAVTVEPFTAIALERGGLWVEVKES